jgi:hypothetical protein
MRRFGAGPYLLGLRRNAQAWGTGFPYDVPAVAAIEQLRLDAPVTLLAGDNGPASRPSSRPRPRRWASRRRAVSCSASGSCRRCRATCSVAPWSRCSARASRATATSCAPRASSTSRSSSTAARSSRPTCRATATQFIIATHSPVLLAIPGARIYELTSSGVAETAYDDLDAVRFTRGFLEAPERYLRAALGDQ